MAESGDDFTVRTGVSRNGPVSVGHAAVTAAAKPADEAKLVRGADVTPGHTLEPTQSTQFGNAPDMLESQPAHDVEPLASARGGGHVRGTHDAADVGASGEFDVKPLGHA